MATTVLCLIPDCSNAKQSKGYCSKHYHRLVRYGDPLAAKQQSPRTRERFIDEVVMAYDGEECIMFPGPRLKPGWPTLTYKGNKAARANRVICELVHGKAPTPRHEAAHTCGNGHIGCINKNHLVWKTHAENMVDTVLHGRSLAGEKHRCARLTAPQVLEIRALKPYMSLAELGTKFGVRRETIFAIVARRSWAHLP